MEREEERFYNKILLFLRGVAIIFLLFHSFYFCWPVFQKIGLYHVQVLKLLHRINSTSGLFDGLLISKLCCVGALLLSCIGEKGKKSLDLEWKNVWWKIILGLTFFIVIASKWIFNIHVPLVPKLIFYLSVLWVGFFFLLQGFALATRILKTDLMKDRFNVENESFMQETMLIENKRSINLPTKFYYQRKMWDGWVNVINPFRGTMIIGTPGSGKSFAVLIPYIKQMIEKGFALYIYDFKMPELTEIAYNHYRLYHDTYEVKPKFCIINFDDPLRTHRCNPIKADSMTDIADAYEAATTVLFNLNKGWVQKSDDFFVTSAINLLTAAIWFLARYKPEQGKNGKDPQEGDYCTFPHVIELLSIDYKILFQILPQVKELENYVKPFTNALEGGAQEQLQGQLASVVMPLIRIISPTLYWVMTGDDFSLDINNPKELKILCVGNNPTRKNIYAAALGLYNQRIVRLINQKGKLRSGVVVDELATIYFKGLDDLINTARSNEVAVCLGFQDFSQLTRDYGQKEADVVEQTVGNVFAGQVAGKTAKWLQDKGGQILQQRQSISINRNDTSTSINTQMGHLLPEGKLAQLSQDTFVGVTADDFEQKLEQKTFHCEMQVDMQRYSADKALYKSLPVINKERGKNAGRNKKYYTEKLSNSKG
jgi:hypothetical protein